MLHYVTTEFAGSRAGKRELIMRFYNLATKKLGQSRPGKKPPKPVTVTDFVKSAFNKGSRQLGKWGGKARLPAACRVP